MLMSSACHTCGYRDSEIKSGGAIAEKARKIVLKVEDEEDLKRDILKVRCCCFFLGPQMVEAHSILAERNLLLPHS